MKRFVAISCVLTLGLLGQCLGQIFPHQQLFSVDGATRAGHTKNPAHSLEEAIQLTENVMSSVMIQQQIPSVVFGISIHNKTIHRAAHGKIDLENNVNASLNALYRMASVTKTFTTTLIGTLVDAGKISYTDSVYKYLSPKIFPRKTWNNKPVDIKVSQVLAHMAGLHVTGNSDFQNLTFPRNSSESLRNFGQEPLHFEPGTDFAYSNTGYEMMGAIIENITGLTYPQAMNSFISKTLKLSNGTLIEQDSTLLHSHLRPRYYRKDAAGNTIPVGVFDEALRSIGIWAAGGLMSNVDDLLLYGNRLLDVYHGRPNAIMSNATLTQIWTARTKNAPHFLPIRPPNEYGYGWFLANVTESLNPNLQYRKFNWHSGGLIGATTFLVIYPEQEIVAVAMANKGAVLGLDIICIDAAELMYEFVPKSQQ